ncbi:MAG: alanine--glyoxylate aminotransferase family protein [Candidatus Methanomethylicota archaeon]|uniref:Alanine--glyoxylate aminotransferase family protein n=1 Tax=Thermoproteota archaeon TaxID=2056631 RepID=A0A497EWT0_9CREN|nr:MAG: alanine--glyoxylate aminotransferase family protein [Candidatus Verstraetearchaeota archaeon]RLE52502.1 MAG: alanine--glyoxylate aminotransferase family protein [Candidatus Verstraetearchaeota archaeon]
MSERRILAIPGPIIFEPHVLRSISIGHLSHMSSEFVWLFAEVLGGLRRLLFVDDDYKVVVLAGSGTLAMEAGVSNFIDKGSRVLVVSNGVFGDRFVELLSQYPVEVDVLKVDEPGEVVSSEKIFSKLSEEDYDLVTVTHVDTSTGVRHPIEELGAFLKDKETLLVVDGVCSVAGEEIRMRDWGIDVVLTGSQKAIGVPPGLAILWLSPKAIEKLDKTKGKCAPYYMNLCRWLSIMRSYENLKPKYFATPAVNLIVGLHESLELIFKEGLEDRFKRHRILAESFRKAMVEIGLKVMAKKEDIAASTVTAVYLPEKVQLSSFLKGMLKRNVVVAGGIYPEIKDRYFRVGHMGPANANDVISIIAAIERTLHDLGLKIQLGSGVGAAQEVLAKHEY